MESNLQIEGVGRLELDASFLDELKFKVLLLDDELDFATSAKSVLAQQSQSVEVDIATTSSEASRMVVASAYDAVLADVDLGPKIATTGSDLGDVWLLSQSEHLQGAYKAIITARPGMIRDHDALRRENVTIATKASEDEDEVYAKVVQLADFKKRKAESAVGKHLLARGSDEMVTGTLSEEISREASELFIDWLATRRNQVSRNTVFRGRLMSFADVQREVQLGTDIGQAFLAMFVRHLRRRVLGAELDAKLERRTDTDWPSGREGNR